MKSKGIFVSYRTGLDLYLMGAGSDYFTAFVLGFVTVPILMILTATVAVACLVLAL